MNHKTAETLNEIMHLAAAALITRDAGIERIALGDIAEVLAKMKVEKVGGGGENPLSTSTSTSTSSTAHRHYLDFCRLSLRAVGGQGQATTIIGKRTNPNPTNPVQIFELKINRPTAACGTTAVATENGDLLFRLESCVGFGHSKRMAVGCLRALLESREKYNHKQYLRRKAKKKVEKVGGGGENPLSTSTSSLDLDLDLAQRMENA